jgi:prevent-host-death family protein
MRTELVTTLKRKITEILAALEADKMPILIMEHGLPKAYLVDIETYERQQKLLTLLEGIARDEDAVEDARVLTHAKAKKRMARWLK